MLGLRLRSLAPNIYDFFIVCLKYFYILEKLITLLFHEYLFALSVLNGYKHLT